MEVGTVGSAARVGLEGVLLFLLHQSNLILSKVSLAQVLFRLHMQQIPFGHRSMLVHLRYHCDTLGDCDALGILANVGLVWLLCDFLTVFGALCLFSFDFDVDAFLDESILNSHVSELRLFE